jgi:uncharacterized surface protein with fasciclin (FAS1) repeats
MKKVVQNLVLVGAVLLLAAAPVAAAGHNSIVDIAVADGRFTTLVAAVQAAGLVETLDSGDWTVFAPTDDAFAKLNLNADNIASAFSKAELTDILLYHVLEGGATSDVAKTVLGDITMANNQRAGLKFFDGSLYVNDDAKVIIENISADNGVIHVVDTVILGPWPRTEKAGAEMAAEAMGDSTIVDIAAADGRFTTLVAAAQAAGLVETLQGGDWTVFAPTDDAFAELDLNANNVAGAFSKAELTDILLYHVLEGGVTFDVAKTVLGDIRMANGELAGLKFFDGSLYVNDDSKVIIENIIADNGVIHVVDTVILGPWPRE